MSKTIFSNQYNIQSLIPEDENNTTTQCDDTPAHEVVAADVVVVHDHLEGAGLARVHAQVKLLQPAWMQGLVLVLQKQGELYSEAKKKSCV